MLKSKTAAFKKLFPARRPGSHKGDYGRVFIYAGSEGMLGAAVLCSRGALRAGAGLVHLGVPLKARDAVNLATPEVIVIGGDKAADFLTTAGQADALALGPGLGERRGLARELLFQLSDSGSGAPAVVDADALNAFAGDLPALGKLKLRLILTPHPGELARLLGRPAAAIQADREEAAAEVAKLLKCVVVLKGHRTVVAEAGRAAYINNTGNPGMASGGMGDVLTGLIAGLAAQGLAPFDAAAAGVYLHGLAGDLATKEKGEYGLIASDLVDHIPEAILNFDV
ncbi:MAG: NAD(P)H-hydrate dehydratase [Candidatus Saganbacteria bacterium]|nr:NAD(P)H-hydrate dehydratase [Candidatus Saganbacteria bacterium]